MTSLPRLVLPGADRFQPGHDLQWWTWWASLDSLDDGRHFCVDFSWCALDGPLPPGFGESRRAARVGLRDYGVSPNLAAGAQDVVIIDRCEHWFHEPDASGFVAHASEGALSVTAGGGADQLSTDLQGYTINLTMTPTEPVTVHGDGKACPFNFGGSTYFYSRKNMRATGTIRTPAGVTHPVGGSGHFDRQYGEHVPVARHSCSLFFIRMSDGSRAYLEYAFGHPPHSVCTLQTGPNGNEVKIPDPHLEVLTWERSPSTFVTYPTTWRLEMSGMCLLIESIECEQSASSLLAPHDPIWKGQCKVTGDRLGTAEVHLFSFDIFS